MEYDHVADPIDDGEVHRSVPPWPVRISEREPGFRKGKSRFRDRASVPLALREESQRFRDELPQGRAIHHVPGGDGRHVVTDLFFGHVRGVQIEAGEQHARLPRVG